MRASATTRRLEEALDSLARRPALSALSCARSLPSRSSWTFSFSTSTFTATTPASSAPTITIQATPPPRRRRDDTRVVRLLRRRAATEAAASTVVTTHLHCHAQPGRRRTRFYLRLTRQRPPHRPGREDAQLRLLAADAHGEVGRTGAAAGTCPAENRFTIRSSSEWKLITASRPPGRSIASAGGSAASSAASSSLTAMRSAWKMRFAGCPSPNRCRGRYRET